MKEHSCSLFEPFFFGPRLLQVVFTRRSAFSELSYPRTHIFHIHNAIIACLTQLLMDFDGFQSYPRTHIFDVHNAITACLTQLLMDFDGFHATQVEESDNHALFLNVAISVSKTLLRLDHVTSIQRVGKCCHLASPNLKDSHVFSNTFHVSICFHSGEKINK